MPLQALERLLRKLPNSETDSDRPDADAALRHFKEQVRKGADAESLYAAAVAAELAENGSLGLKKKEMPEGVDAVVLATAHSRGQALVDALDQVPPPDPRKTGERIREVRKAMELGPIMQTHLGFLELQGDGPVDVRQNTEALKAALTGLNVPTVSWPAVLTPNGLKGAGETAKATYTAFLGSKLGALDVSNQMYGAALDAIQTSRREIQEAVRTYRAQSPRLENPVQEAARALWLLVAPDNAPQWPVNAEGIEAVHGHMTKAVRWLDNQYTGKFHEELQLAMDEARHFSVKDSPS
jgi:hypothetical protein